MQKIPSSQAVLASPLTSPTPPPRRFLKKGDAQIVTMALVGSLFAMSLFLLADLDSFNRTFDCIVPVYTVAAVVLVVAFFKYKSAQNVLDSGIDTRKFEFKKKSKLESLTWKQKYFGEFVKVERTGLAEFFMFNGAPGFMARSMASDNFSQIITHAPGDETTIRVASTGTPQVDGCFLRCPDSEDAVELLQYKDTGKHGSTIQVKLYWSEADHALCTRYVDNKGWTGTQRRTLVDDHTMNLYTELTNDKGVTATYTAVLKRK